MGYCFRIWANGTLFSYVAVKGDAAPQSIMDILIQSSSVFSLPPLTQAVLFQSNRGGNDVVYSVSASYYPVTLFYPE
jgi:hypothetical protein